MPAVRAPHRLTLVLAVATATMLGALATRMVVTGTTRYSFLAWNLFLAWLPYAAALVVTWLVRRDRPGVLPMGVLWLVFWPNAPYIVTDVVHLRRPGAMITWVEIALVAGFAATGVALGLASLLLMHRIVATRRGRLAGIVLVAMALPLCAIGIYLGRVHRFNSWDAFTNPLGVLRTVAFDLSGPLSNPAMLALVAAMTGCLAVGYAITWLVARASGAAGRPDPVSWPWPGSHSHRRR